jgi:hypothetical protein
MGRRSRFVLVFGVALAIASCGGREHQPPGETGGGGTQAGNGGAGGSAGSGAPDGGTSSPLPFVSPGASFAPGSICEADGWCWIDPIPTGDWWQGIGGVDRSEVWIGGMSQNVLHLSGGHWASMVSPLDDTEGIWASAANDVWFGGTVSGGVAGIAHWDGQGISLTVNAGVGSGEINDLWASGPNDVYAAGFGLVEHWDGSAWSVVPGVVGSGVSGSAPDDVWIATSDGLSHFDGTSWSRVPQFQMQFVQSVAVAGRDDVWVAVLHDGLQDVDHFDGTSWTNTLEIPATGSQISLQALGIGVGGDVWLVGTAFEAVDQRGYLARFDGTSWSEGPHAPTPLVRVRGVPGVGDLAVGRNGGILLLAPTSSPAFTDLRSGPEEDLTGVWGSSPTDMWAAGRAGTLLHFDGQHVSAVPTGVTVDLTDVWGTAADDVWIVGRGGTAFHFDGTSLQPVATGTTADLLAVFTAARGDVWMGGSGATVLRMQGGSIEPAALAGLTDAAAILDLHGLGSDDVWLSGGPDPSVVLSGEPGFVAHFDGTAWSAVDPLTLNNGGFPIRRIWELAPDNVWVFLQPLFRAVVGYWHFDGTAWTNQAMPDSPTTFMFPRPPDALGSFVFGLHDRWVVGALGAWMHNTQ